MQILVNLIRSIAAATLLAGATAMAAPCTEEFNLGVMGPPALRSFGNEFRAVQHFEDCYSFTLAGSADVFGFSLAFDGSLPRDIVIDTFTLTGGSLGSPVVDDSPSSFSVDNLLAGTYQFVITGDVTGRDGGLLGGGQVGYGGNFISTVSQNTNPIPEPSGVVLLATSLLLLTWTHRRSRRC